MDLPAENIFGHTRKLQWMRGQLAGLRMRLGRPISILDLGCGNGRAVTRYLGVDGDEVLGVDFHAPSIAYAQRFFGRPGLCFQCADVMTMELRSGGWDAIVLADVLEHLASPTDILRRSVDLLAPGGSIFVSVPNGRGVFEIESAISRARIIGPALIKVTDLFVAVLNKFVLKGYWTRGLASIPKDIPYNHDSPHVQFLTRRRWRRLFANADLVTIGERSLSVIGGPFTNYLFGATPKICRFNSAAAAHVPAATASNWAFELAPKAP